MIFPLLAPEKTFSFVEGNSSVRMSREDVFDWDMTAAFSYAKGNCEGKEMEISVTFIKSLET